MSSFVQNSRGDLPAISDTQQADREKGINVICQMYNATTSHMLTMTTDNERGYSLP